MLAAAGSVVIAVLSLIGGLLPTPPPPPPPQGPATVTVTPETVALNPGGTRQLTVVVLDARGRPMNPPKAVWTSSAPSVATVSASGLVQAVAPGTATIKAASGSASDTSIVTVTPVNTAPTLTITAPAEGAFFPSGTPITFTATASDPQQGDLTGAIQWSVGGTGASVTTSTLPIGTHTVTATVTDAGGLTASDTATIEVENRPPTVTITSPADGTSVLVGQNVSFTATASDPEDGDITALIIWSVGGAGGTTSTSTLPVGANEVQASVVDGNGAGFTASITVNVRAATPPTVTINPAGPFLMNQRVVLTATAADAEDGDRTSAIQWSLAGAPVGTGRTVDLGVLTPGVRTITATVTDVDGHTTSTTRQFQVLTNQAQVVTIITPAVFQTIPANVATRFEATATDPEDGDVSSTIIWTARYVSGPSSGWFDIPLGTGRTVSATLAAGTYEVTARSVHTGFSVGRTHRMFVADAGRAPTVTITSPGDGATFTTLDTVTATATATDADGNDLSGSIQWIRVFSSGSVTSVGTGSSVTVGRLPAGTWRLVASVMDGAGVGASHQITLNVTAAP